jgi:hypothetical protein
MSRQQDPRIIKLGKATVKLPQKIYDANTLLVTNPESTNGHT